MRDVYVLTFEVDHEGDDLLGVFATCEQAIDAARSIRKQGYGSERWTVYKVAMGSTSERPIQVWTTQFSHGPSSDGRYGWHEVGKATGDAIVHVRTPEGYLYPTGFG
jgi:hypothetical protein